jgi:hypothetical protein
MECTRGTHGSVQVTSDGRMGYLYFDAGQIVHARYGGAIGERALFEMLRWRGGDVTPVERAWPTRATIQQSWQNLLLRAAQEQDETAPERVSSVGTIEARGADVLPFTPTTTRATDNDSGMHRSLQITVERRESTQGTGDEVDELMNAADVHDLAEIDVDGELVREKGNAELLAQTGAYVARLATLIADSLGLEPLEQLHAHTAQAQCVVRVERQTIVALRAGRRADLTRYLGTASP